MGKVYIIGAGPYDEELITLKAVRILKKCDVVLYDRLINKGLLKYLRDDCRVYYCGKENGNHFKTQEEINEMMVRFAMSGYTVGRIKGGDPFVFGRGSEEALILSEKGIPFEVVPGISSALAVPCYAGIPLTHRMLSQSFHVFTGRSARKLLYDWKVVAKLTGTLVFLMGMENLEEIVFNLLSNGMDPKKPCAVISRGTSGRQKTIACVLENVPKILGNDKILAPAIFIVGEVVSLREVLNWYESKPLFGRRICITRPKEQSVQFKEKLMDLGAEVLEVNAIRIRKMEDNLKEYIDKLDTYDFIIFTSTNGVENFFAFLVKSEYDLRRIKAKFACIGEKTYKALKNKCIIAECLADEYISEALFEKLRPELKKGTKVLIPQAREARRYLTEMLSKEGCQVDEVSLYEVLTEDPVEIDLSDVDYFTFASPSSVKSFVELYGTEVLKKGKIVAIGPVTADKLKEYKLKAEVAAEYTTDGIIKKILALEGYDV